MECELKKTCSGCSEWDIPYENQVTSKLADFKAQLNSLKLNFLENNIEIKSIDKYGLRDRLDFVIENGKMGLFSHETKAILDIPKCLQLSPALQLLYTEFRKINWPINKGSFRLRIGPQGEKGAWLDFSNEDIKKLFEERSVLTELQKICHIEIGQRRKKLTWDIKENRFRLLDSELQNWTNSTFHHKSIQLYSTIGSFSQVGHKANETIQKSIEVLCNVIHYDAFLEYGAGHGNLTFPALTNAKNATVIETDPIAVAGLTKTTELNNLTDLIKIYKKTPEQLSLNQFQMILANPPRSGLQDLLKLLQNQKTALPKYFIYMSCYPESYFKDLLILTELGYKFNRAILIDQFPQTKHYEILSLLELA